MTEPLVGPSGLSPSSLDLWLQCPSKFKKEKVERRPTGGAGIDAVVGTYVHLVLEYLCQLPPEARTLEAAKRFFQSSRPEIEARSDYQALGLGGGDQPYVGPAEEAEKQAAARMAFQRRVWASVNTYFEIENPAHVDIIATEQKLDAVIRGVPLRGIVDRMERDAFDDLVISDYKSGKVPAPMFRESKYRQLNMYAAMVEETTGELATDGRLIFTSFGKVLPVRFTRDSVDEAVQVAVDAWDDIGTALETDEWTAGVGPLCGWCEFAAECPEGLEEIRWRRANKKLKTAAPNYELAAAV